MIRRIFRDLLAEDYRDMDIARAFGLKKSTYSRFGGSDWWKAGRMVISDLWLNVAETIARHRKFIEVAREAGVWERVKAILGDPRFAEEAANE
jgi:hypothetical protein